VYSVHRILSAADAADHLSMRLHLLLLFLRLLLLLLLLLPLLLTTRD
jgi:hypothetical protein